MNVIQQIEDRLSEICEFLDFEIDVVSVEEDGISIEFGKYVCVYDDEAGEYDVPEYAHDTAHALIISAFCDDLVPVAEGEFDEGDSEYYYWRDYIAHRRADS
jgi:hypothetical protein